MKTPDGVCVNREKKNNKLTGVLEKAGFDIGYTIDIAEFQWVIVEGTDKLYAACKIVSTLVSRMEEATSGKPDTSAGNAKIAGGGKNVSAMGFFSWIDLVKINDKKKSIR